MHLTPRLYLSSTLPLENSLTTTPKSHNSKNTKFVNRTLTGATMCDGDCRPLGFLLGLPFAFLSLLLSIVGVVIWIVGLLLSCICPCCLCVTVLVEIAIGLIKAPIHVMEWFMSKIPC